MSRLDDAISETAYVLDVLMTYRRIAQSGDCNSCAVSKKCKYAPKLGELVRYNCPFYKRRVPEPLQPWESLVAQAVLSQPDGREEK